MWAMFYTSYTILFGKNVFLFQLSKCVPIPESEILMYSDSGKNGYHPTIRIVKNGLIKVHR